jgi:hypothetical protein
VERKGLPSSAGRFMTSLPYEELPETRREKIEFDLGGGGCILAG